MFLDVCTNPERQETTGLPCEEGGRSEKPVAEWILKSTPKGRRTSSEGESCSRSVQTDRRGGSRRAPPSEMDLKTASTVPRHQASRMTRTSVIAHDVVGLFKLGGGGAQSTLRWPWSTSGRVLLTVAATVCSAQLLRVERHLVLQNLRHTENAIKLHGRLVPQTVVETKRDVDNFAPTGAKKSSCREHLPKYL